MPAARQRVEQLKSRHTKAELKDLLGEALGESYHSPVPNTLKNDFLQVCFRRIAPNEDVKTRLQQHDDYSPDWAQKGTKHNFATAIRMVLTERVGRDKHDSITSLSKSALAELVVACRMADTTADIKPAPDNSQVAVPALPTPSPSPFDESIDITEESEARLAEWIRKQRSGTDGPHAVYVLDCTPTSAEDENSRLKSLRAAVSKTDTNQESLSPLERAGSAANQGLRVYYVGYTADIGTRLHQHRRGAAAASARFTNLFEPHTLVEINWFDTEARAKAFEKQRASELTVDDAAYAYWN